MHSLKGCLSKAVSPPLSKTCMHTYRFYLPAKAHKLVAYKPFTFFIHAHKHTRISHTYSKLTGKPAEPHTPFYCSAHVPHACAPSGSCTSCRPVCPWTKTRNSFVFAGARIPGTCRRDSIALVSRPRHSHEIAELQSVGMHECRCMYTCTYAYESAQLIFRAASKGRSASIKTQCVCI